MTNGEKFKTAEARTIAFHKFCAGKICKGKEANCIFSDKIHDIVGHKCEFAWLDLEYKEELKPCPFCGCGVIELEIESHTGGIYAVCSGCGCRMEEQKNEKDAVWLWNRRSK